MARRCDGETDYNASNIVKWLIEHYSRLAPEQRPIECTLKAGEVIYVPSGWWHAVLNLEDTIAVTQNFVGPFNFHVP